MNRSVSYPTRQELVAALRSRYRHCKRSEKTRILDEFVALTGVHRKHAIRVLRGNETMKSKDATHAGTKIYDEAVGEALVVVWEAADRICGKRLKAILPEYVSAMERHGHLALDPEVKKKLLQASAATLDRLLRPKREKARPRKRKRSKTKPSQQIAIKTFADWKEPQPGYCEIDFVVHCGGSMSGEVLPS